MTDEMLMQWINIIGITILVLIAVVGSFYCIKRYFPKKEKTGEFVMTLRKSPETMIKDGIVCGGYYYHYEFPVYDTGPGADPHGCRFGSDSRNDNYVYYYSFFAAADLRKWNTFKYGFYPMVRYSINKGRRRYG